MKLTKDNEAEKECRRINIFSFERKSDAKDFIDSVSRALECKANSTNRCRFLIRIPLCFGIEHSEGKPLDPEEDPVFQILEINWRYV